MQSDAFTLEYELPAPAAEVWRYLTDTQLLERWYWPASLEPRYEANAVPGGKFRFASDVAGMVVTGTYLEADAPRQFVKTWRWDGSDEETEVRVTLVEPAGGGTRLTLVHSGHLDEGSLENHRTGWSDCLDRLVTVLG